MDPILRPPSIRPIIAAEDQGSHSMPNGDFECNRDITPTTSDQPSRAAERKEQTYLAGLTEVLYQHDVGFFEGALNIEDRSAIGSDG
jgi:hypothetical protein